ncbi:MAG TPA: AAA family ATPase [Acidimicrobiia bacterium]
MLLEREDLLASLADFLREAGNENGSMMLVAGEAGAGKTSLVDAFTDSLGEGILVIRGACDPLTTPRPLSPLYDFAADPDSGMSDLATGDKDAVEMFQEVLDRLRNTIRPIVMVIEDIHWADEATLDFLRFIGRRVSDSKAMVICTYRDDEVGPDHPLRPVLGQLIPLGSTHRIVVPPLTIDAIRKLSENHAVHPDELMRLTDGNAFFVTEVLASGEGLPATVQEAVLARVAQLGPVSRRIVEGVSVAPRSLTMDHASALVGGRVEDIDHVLASGVLVSEGTNLRFRHELARSAVETSMPPARRLSLHRRMLALLEEDHSPDIARLAHHSIAAMESELIAQYAPDAAREAKKRNAHKEAVSFYEAAIEYAADELGPDETARVRVDLSFELGIVDRQNDALVQVQLAEAHFRATDQTTELAMALDRKAGAQWRLHDIPGARRSTDESIELLRPLGPSRDLAYALYHSSHFHMLARHGEPAMRDIVESMSVAESTAAEDVLWMGEMMIGTIKIVLGQAVEGMEILEKALLKAEDQNNSHGVSVALSMLGSGGGEARLYDAALDALDQGIVQGLATDQDYTVAYDRAWHARIAFEQGRWDDAVAYAELVRRTSPSQTGIAMTTALGALARVRVRRGDPGGSELLAEVLKTESLHELQHVWSPISGLAEHHWLGGRLEEMEPVLAGGYRRALDTDSEWARGELGYWMWKAGAIDSPPDGAAEPFALQMSGKWGEAADLWREIGSPYEVGLSLSEGDVEAMKEALEIFDTLGARPMADRVRRRLREMGAESIPRGPSRATRENPAGLTNRQVEVLELISGGLSNAEIADRLFISKKTVEHHVSAIYSKLGVDSRTKAAAAFRDHI